MKYYYHATSMNNLISILNNGIKPSTDGLVYICENETDAVKFVAIRGFKEILTCKIKMLKADEEKIQETFDHSEAFFKCRAFGYNGEIPPNKIVDYRKFVLDN